MERREKKKNGGIKETRLEVVHRQIIDNSDETNFTNAYFPLYLVFHILEIEQQAAVLGLVSWRDVLMDCIQPILNLIGNLLHLLFRSVLQVACIFTPVRRGRRGGGGGRGEGREGGGGRGEGGGGGEGRGEGREGGGGRGRRGEKREVEGREEKEGSEREDKEIEEEQRELYFVFQL